MNHEAVYRTAPATPGLFNITVCFCLAGKFYKMKSFFESRTRRNEEKRSKFFVSLIIFLILFASFEIHKLFLFLFVQKLATQIYSYSHISW